jgi:hypothetical protein
MAYNINRRKILVALPAEFVFRISNFYKIYCLMVAYELRLGGDKKLSIKYLRTERKWEMRLCVCVYVCMHVCVCARADVRAPARA